MSLGNVAIAQEPGSQWEKSKQFGIQSLAETALLQLLDNPESA